MLTGVILQGLGLSVLIRLKLGTDPCSCLTQGIICHVPLSFGTAQLLCNLITFAFVLIYNRRMIGLGTIGNMVCLGYVADFFGMLWKYVLPESIFTEKIFRFLLLVPALLVFILGAALYMNAGLGTSPYDALPFIIADRAKKFSFRTVRMLWDISFMAFGFILGGNVGIVTVAVAFFMGPVIQLVQKILQKPLLFTKKGI